LLGLMRVIIDPSSPGWNRLVIGGGAAWCDS
jgi:hypothetical protein